MKTALTANINVRARLSITISPTGKVPVSIQIPPALFPLHREALFNLISCYCRSPGRGWVAPRRCAAVTERNAACKSGGVSNRQYRFRTAYGSSSTTSARGPKVRRQARTGTNSSRKSGKPRLPRTSTDGPTRPDCSRRSDWNVRRSLRLVRAIRR